MKGWRWDRTAPSEFATRLGLGDELYADIPTLVKKFQDQLGDAFWYLPVLERDGGLVIRFMSHSNQLLFDKQECARFVWAVLE